MTLPFDAALLLKTARRQAGLSQRGLAERAGTAQSVVARIELGETDPGTKTLARLLAAAGVEVRCTVSPAPVVDSHMLEDVDRILALSPEDRLREVAGVFRLLADARRV